MELWEKRILHALLWWVNMKANVHVEDLSMNSRIVLKLVVKK
jgi:hypothetical protein